MTDASQWNERSSTERRRKKSYSTAVQVRQRYGGRSAMWLWRKLKVDPKFPRPLDMGPNLKLFDDDELNAYDDALRAARASDTSEGA